MNVFILLVLVLPFCYFFLAYFLYKEYRESRFHKFFIRVVIVAGLFIFIIYLLSNSKSIEEARFWIRLLAVSHLLFPFINDSLLQLLKDKISIKRRLKNLILYLPFIIMLIIDLAEPGLTFDEPKLTKYGWVYVNKVNSQIFLYYNLVYCINIIGLIFFLAYYYFKSHEPSRRRFIFFFALSFLTPFSLFLIFTILFKNGTLYLIPFMAIAGTISFVIIFWFLSRYGIFDISLDIALKDIPENMINMLFLINRDTLIVEINKEVCRVLRYQKNDIIGLPFTELVNQADDVIGSLDELSEKEVLLKTKSKKLLPVLVSVSKVYRKRNFLGYMIIGNDLSFLHKITDEKKILHLELKALQTQMNPHFIFNALNSILYLIKNNEDDRANFYITNLSSLIRKVMINVDKQLISVKNEIEVLEAYLSIESLRFEDFNFKYRIVNDPDLNSSTPILPPMIIQPFVENAIWHGLITMDKNTEKNLDISFRKLKDTIRITIDDNGIGRKASYETRNPRRHVSQGIKKISERINLFNSYSGSRSIDFHIIDKTDIKGRPKGTQVIIELKNLR